VLRCAAGQLPSVSVFGNNYPTPDGTPIRDYIHVPISVMHIFSRSTTFAAAVNPSGLTSATVRAIVLEVIEKAREVTVTDRGQV